MTLNFAAINKKRQTAMASAENAFINSEARLANELQAATGCTRTAALMAAKAAMRHCTVDARGWAELNARIESPTLTIRCTTNPRFAENWSDPVQVRERCDELNRELDHPAYFVA